MKPRIIRSAAAVAMTSLVIASLAACSSAATPAATDKAEKVTITITGPNQWNSNPSSFGAEWEAQIARFKKAEPNIDVKTVVLPLTSFGDTLATQLSAGTASELVFNQAAHQPYMVTPLNDYLEKPNPYVEGNKKWIDLFNKDLFGPANPITYNTEGNNEFIPFNVFVPVVYYNTEAFKKAGVKAPITNWTELATAAAALKKAGYAPFAADNAPQGLMWTLEVIADQIVTNAVYDTLNKFDTKGAPGSNYALTAKDWAMGVREGKVDATKIPEVKASLELLKKFYDDYVTPNWSGVTGSGAAVINQADFASGKAAMAWGSSFGYATVSEEAKFTVSAMPFPTITTATSKYSDGITARYGASIYGSSYMIPSTIKGDKLAASVKFLQFMSAPEKVSTWLAETGSLSALKDTKAPANLTAFVGTDWLKPRQLGSAAIYPPDGTTGQDLYGGYLLGTKTIDQMLTAVQASWQGIATQNIKKGGWTEPWATK